MKAREAVSTYRCYFIDANGRIARPAVAFEASHDDKALEHVRRLCDEDPQCVGVELWCGAQQVGAYRPKT